MITPLERLHDEAKEKGYAIVEPYRFEIKLGQPELVKHGAKYGVKIKATAPVAHVICTEIETEINPLVGNEKQCEELMSLINDEIKNNPAGALGLNIFGKPLGDMVEDGIQRKLGRIPEDAQAKLRDTLQRIVNEGSGGLICIIL